MRILITNLLAVAALMFGASAASAFDFYMQARNATSSLVTSDTVTIDVFFNADAGGLTILSVGVLNTAAGLTYDAAASQALPIIHAAPPTGFGTTGSQPGYILYSAAVGMVAPAASLYPLQTPVWATWPTPPAGTEQVNISFSEPAFGVTFATGANIWVGSLVYHVDAGFAGGDVALAFTSANIVDAGGNNITDQVGLSGPIALTGVVPEPTTAALIGLGVLGLAVAGRRK